MKILPVCLLAFALAFGISPKSEAWYLQSVGGRRGSGGSLALDSSGLPRIAYTQSNEYHYAAWTGSSWNDQVVTNSPWTDGHVGLVLDASGAPSFFYQDNPQAGEVYIPPWCPPHGQCNPGLWAPQFSNNVVCAETTAGTWTHTLIRYDGVTTAARFDLDIFPDRSGGMSVLYQVNNDKVCLALRLEGSGHPWSESTLDATNLTAFHIRGFAVDKNGRTCILNYYPRLPASDSLQFARWQDGVWQVASLGTEASTGSLVIDGANHAHAAWATAAGELRYATDASGSWVVTNLASGARAPVLAADSSDRPHLLFVNGEEYPLKYARWTGSAWAIETIPDSYSTNFTWHDLKLDAADQPHIAYLAAGDALSYGTKSSAVIPPQGALVSQYFPDSKYLASDWWWSSWFSFFSAGHIPWIYHNEHGWLYPVGTGTSSIFFWDNSKQTWWWSSATTYPYLYRFSDSTWFWYQKGSANPRWFYNLKAGDWESW